MYSDTPAGTYSWGTLAAQVKERENPDFTANSTLHTDYSSTYGWTTNSGWVASADSQHDNSEANYGAWKAFDKLNNTFWHSNHSSGVSETYPAFLRIQYPSSQVIKSYNITSRNDDTNTRFPSVWKLQGYDGSSWVDVGSEQTVTTWTPGATKRFDVSTNITAYTKYQLRITTTIRSASATSTSDYAAIAAWKLYTLNSENNTVHDDHTEYTYTPQGTITTNILRVAGGGAAGNTRSGGGGAGGLLYSENVSLSGSKKIVVGNGGEGKIGNQQMGDKGHDTLFEGLTTVVGGGSAAGERPGTEGGSSGGNSGRNTSAATAPYPSGQGNAGGTAGADNTQGAGGGGAGGVGANQSSGVGGVGVDYSSVFGTMYGDSGWFAGGGAGGGGVRAGGQGGGGDGTDTGTPSPGQKHTGGGAGGRGNSDNTNKMPDGGSGIVIIKKLGAANPPALNFDGYNKLSIDNVTDSKVSAIPYFIDNTTVSTGESGWEASESSFQAANSNEGEFKAYKALDGIINRTVSISNYHSNNSEQPWIKIKSPNPFTFNQYKLTSRGGDGAMSYTWHPAVWTIDGSNDDSTWTTIDTQNSYHNWGGEGITHTFNVSNTTPYTYYRLNCTDSSQDDGNHNGQNYLCISEWELLKDATLESVTIKKDGAAFATTTSNTVYIRDTGTYTAEVKSLGSYVTELSKVVTGSIDTSVLNEVSNVSGSSSFASGINTTGFSFSSDGNRVVIGEPESHKIHIYNYINNTWTLDKTVTKDNNFGSSVVISKNGNKIIACKKQVAYLFINGVETTSIQPADCTTTFGQSGLSISNDGNYVVVGDYSHGSDTGKVYVYDISNNSFSVSTSMNGTSVGDTAGKTTLLNKDGTRLFYTDGSVIKIYQRTNSTWQSTTSISVSGSISIDEDGDRIAVGESDSQSGTIYLRQKYQNSWSGIINYKSGVGLSQWVQTVNTEWTQTNGSAAWGWPISNNNSANAYLPWNGRWYKFTSPTELYEFTGDGTVNNTQVPDENTTGTAKTTTDTVDGITYYRIHRANDSHWGEHLLVARFVQDGSGIDDIVTIYVRNSSNGTFSLEQTITGVSGDAYGSSVSLNGGGDKLFIGSKNNGSGKGLIEYWTKDSSNTWNKKRDDIVGETTTDKIGDYIATNLLGSVLGTHSSNDKLFIYNSDIPSITYDGKNKLTVGGTNYADTATVSDPNGSTYSIGTAKTMYVKDEGEYVFKISGTDKYVESNVHVSSVDLAGATTKPISFDGYNKLTLIDAGANAVSNVTLGATTYDLGSAKVFYIKDRGTYDLEMSGSNVFALSSNVVDTVDSNPTGTYSTISNIDGTGTKLGASHSGHPISFNAVGTRVVIGEYNTHKAHVYDKVGASWTLSQTWTKSNGFGKSCAMSDDGNVVVVVENSGTNKLSLFVYENGSWVTKQNQISISGSRDTFGSGLFMSGNGLYLLVTDYSYQGSGGRGRNKIFDISEYSFLERHNHGFSNDASSWYGDIDRYGNRAIYDDGHSDYWHVYKRSGSSWSQSTTIAPSNTSGKGPASCDENMVRVALSDISNSNAGVTIWYRDPSGDTFALEQTITVDNAGCNISMNYAGDRLMITDKTAGDIEIWTRSGTTWTKQKTINPPTFGTLVNLAHTANKGDGYTLATVDETYDSNKGRVYIYSDPITPSLTFDNYNKLTVSNFTSTDIEWPPASFTSPTFSSSTITGVTTTNNGKDQTWTISGAAYGNGEYSASFDGTIHNNANYHGPVRCFDKVNDGFAFHSSSVPTGIVTLNMPENIILDSYELRHRPNANTSENYAPRDWTLEGSNDGTTWVVLDTQSSQSYNPDVQGDEVSKRTYTVSNNSTSYSRYRLNITANDGGPHLVIGQWKLFASNPRTGTLTDPNGSTYALGQTQDTIYIKDTGDYTLDVTNNDQKAIVLKNVSGTISNPPGYSSATPTLVDPINITSGIWSSGNYAYYQTHATYYLYRLSLDNGSDRYIRYDWVSLVWSDNDQGGTYSTFGTSATDLTSTARSITNPTHIYLMAGSQLHATMVNPYYQVPSDFPSLNFDTYNKLTIANADSDATSNIDFFSNTYEMGSRKELIINDYGTYHANIYSSNTLALVKKQVTDTFPTAETQKIVASDRGSGDKFGTSVFIDGNYIIVGTKDSTGNSPKGAAYIYKRNSSTGVWGDEQKIEASDKQAGDNFGDCVSISGDYAIVGASREDTGGNSAGAAYIYKRNSSTGVWGDEQKIQASDKQAGDRFGFRVSISGDYAIVGSMYEDTGVSGAGAAYIYKRNTSTGQWGDEKKIQASDKELNDWFGMSVGISGDYVVIGAQYEDTNGSGAGSAYIYKRNVSTGEWGDEQKIQSSDIQPGDLFGNNVSISGDYVIASAILEDTGGSAAGAAYIYKRNASTGVWEQQAKIQASDKQTEDRFGRSLHINGDYAIVGAFKEDTGATDAGAAYIYKRTGSNWEQQSKIQASDAQSEDHFGYSVGISGRYAIVGAWQEDEDTSGGNTLNSAGSSYIFERPPDIGPAPDITIAFHFNTFSWGGDPYSDGSVTAAATAGHIYSDTPTGTYTWGTLDSASTASQQTTYTWTPASTVTSKVLMVAGGGGGGNSDNNNGGGGGGGAGGVVYNSSVSLSGQQTITVGGNNSAVRGDGVSTTFTGLTTAFGGGKGAGSSGGASAGGSGGGAFRNGTGGAGTSGQGYAGGNGSSTYSPWSDQGGSGGGGAGGVGADATDANGANGGIGLDYSSVFGTTYGESGWFASGGGGGFHSGSPGTASNGGGTSGGATSGSTGATGQKHTGGGGGGGSIASGPGSYGGSGIVLVQIPSASPSLTFDGYNKLTPPVLEASFTATRLSDWDNNNQSKSPNSGKGDWPGTSFTGESDAHWWTLHNNDKVYTSSYNYGTTRDAAQLFTTVTSSDWNHGYHTQTGWNATKILKLGYKFTVGSKTLGSMKLWQAPASHPTGDVTIKYWDGTSLKTVTNQSPSGFPSSISYYTEQEFTFNSANAQYWLIECKTHASSPSTNYIGLAGWQLLSGRDPVSTVLTKGSDSYDIGTASSIYIDAAGTYDAQAKNSNTFVIKTSNVVSGTLSRKQVWKADGTEDQILYSSDIAAADAFGERIAIDGNYAVVGARQADPNGTLSGAAYVFYKSGGTWSQQQKLVASDSSANYEFGYCVDISGDTIVVGSGPYDGSPGSDSGKVYVFKRTGTTWTQQAAFQSSDIQTSDYFGWSVSIHGDYIIAGARVEDTGGSNAGSAYIFKKYELGRAWPPIAPSGSYTLTNSNKDVEWTVSGATYGNGTYRAKSNKGIHGSSFIYHPGRMFDYNISDYYEFHTGSGEWDQSGTVDIDIEFPTSFVLSSYELTIAPYTVSSYAPTNWTILGSNDGSTWSSALDTQTQMSQLGGEIYTLTGNTTAYNHYRLSVSATPQNNCVVRELRYYQSSSTEPTITRWSQQAKIQSKHINANDNFGSSVSIHGDYAIIASYLYDEDHPDVASNRGAAYIFKREGTTWRQQIQLQPSDPGADDHFGGDTQGVDIYGDYAVVGARLEDSNGSNAGSAYVFKKTSTTLSTVKNPYFTDASTIETNGNWSSSTGFEITASSVGASQNGYNAFDNTYTADNAWESTWLSGSSMPAWVQIQYPEDVVIKSYTIVGRDATNRYYPTSWQLQGATAAAPSTYVNLETTSGNRTASSWAPLAEVSHNVNTPNTAYRSFRLYVNSSNENNQVSINELKLYTTPLSGQSATVEESWTQQAKIQASDVQLNSQFGVCVSISGDRLVVGAVSDDRTATDAGAAYIFERSGTNWTEVKKITASDAQASDSFGISVAIDGTNVIVGAYGEDTNGTGAGAAYVYEKVYVGPTLTYDNANKLSLTGVTTPSSNLTVGTNTYDIGSAKDVYIKDQGTYKFHTNDGDQALLMSNVVSSTPSGTTYTYTQNDGIHTPLTLGIDGITGWYEANSFNTTTQTWVDLSGNGYDAARTRGTVYKNDTGLNGLPIIYGGTGDGGIQFPADAMGGEPTTYTIFTVAKYGSDQSTSGTRGRIFDGYNNNGGYSNWLTGFHNNKSGVAHHHGWITSSSTDSHGYNWVLSTSQHSMYRSNGTNRTTANGTRGPTYFFINSNYETTTWSVAEVILYKGKNLTSEEYTKVEEYLNGKYDITSDVLKNYSRISTLSGTLPSQVYDNTKTITVSNIPSGTSTVGKIYKGVTAYTIHATEPTSNVIIKNTGSYVSVFTTSSTAYFTNTVNVNATPTTTSDDNTIEDEAPVVTATATVSATVAFHHGTFADSDDPHGDGSITAAATAGHIYSDTAAGTYTWGTLTSGTVNAASGTDSGASRGNHTPGNTTYKWTPPGTITGARMLLVGGGGGGGMNMGGGGGAGGFLALASKDISASEQTVVVGRGGDGSPAQSGSRNTNSMGQAQGSSHNSYHTPAYNGGDSSISGETAYGGGSGGYSHDNDDRQHGGNGGSGGGVSGYGAGGRNNPGGTGVSGQGNSGGTSNTSHYSGGGGGAGEAGTSANHNPHGGDGLSSDILGTEYWWSGGGGGSGYSGNGGDGGKGGGGGGAIGTNPGGTGGLTVGGNGGGGGQNSHANTPGGDAGKHTGGGGGGGAHYYGNNYGGNGGSGIVAIKFTAGSGSEEGIPGSTAVPSASSSTTDAPSTVLVATTEVAAPTLNLDFTANMSTFPRNLKRYNSITNSSIGARFNRTESRKKRVHKSINTDKFSIELTANNMGDSSSSSSTLPVTVVNSGAGTQYTSGWTTTGSTSSFVVPSDAPNALYYYCQNHDGMGGSISVSSASTTTHTVTVVSSSAGTQYTSGWTASGTPGSSGGINTFIAPSNAPNTLYYYCGNHSGMGGAINMVSGPVSTTFAVTVQSVSGYYGSSNKYFIDGTQQATISLVRGKTYTFNNNASGSHPMYITTSSDGTTYTSGVTNGGTSSVTFAVPLNAPSTLYYKCGVHGGMGGTINILGPTASPLAVTVAGGKFVIGGVSQATLQLVRGETYVFNQVDTSNGTHPLRLSTTSNGTHVSGGSGFYIGGTQRPTLSMVRGNTYTFDQTNASNGSHVLQIASASDGTQYTSGYTTGTFVVPLSAPDTLYYKSSTTSGMGGLINVTGSTTSAFVVTASGGNFSIGGVEQASLSVIRGLTYTFNQISGHVLSLSSTSDGTRNTGVNKYYISGVETPTLTFIRGSTYTFTQETSTNTGHPIRLSETSNGTHASGSQYTSGWTTTGTPGSSGASSQFIVPANAPNTLYYYCQHHSGMGGASSINVADSNSGIILTYGTHALVANSTVSGEYTIATNFDGTTSNLYVNGDLISQTTPTIASGAKTIKIGEDYNGLIKNLKFWNYAKSFLQQALVEGTFEKHGINGNSTSYFLLGARAVEATPWYSGYSMPRSTSKADAFAITSGGTSGGTNTSQGTYPTIDPGPSIGSGHVVANSFHFATDMTKVDKIYFLSANGTYGLEFSLQDYANVPAPATGGGDAGGTITITDKFGYTATSIYVLKRVSNPEDPWINTGTTHNYTQMFYGDSTGNANGSHMSDNGGFYIYASLI